MAHFTAIRTAQGFSHELMSRGSEQRHRSTFSRSSACLLLLLLLKCLVLLLLLLLLLHLLV